MERLSFSTIVTENEISALVNVNNKAYNSRCAVHEIHCYVKTSFPELARIGGVFFW